MWDFIKLPCVERNGSARVYLAVMASAKDDRFVLSNLCHLRSPVEQPVLKTRAGEAEPEKIITSINLRVPGPRTDRKRLMDASPLLPPTSDAPNAAPSPGVSRGIRSRGGGLDPSGWHAVNYVLALHTALH